ncbi:DUF6864 domain-containing function [Vibrio cholerae]|uniref:DUF6864 domain-containing function n=1 Tax=Vibrio cholerae TaxID=666 RepID=UPI001DD8DCF5|nr:hypothetical protein [Vibrio cholerae]EGR2123796.1 hypothetical protein [Vibrio cholerae]MCX9600209.1 hypothetical protein [Vibrio cholerae]
MNKYGIQVSKFTNGLEVLDSGVVHISTPDIEFRVDNLTIRFLFEQDSGSSRYEGQVEEGILVFRLFNFQNPLGEGLDEPVPIASIKGRELYLQFYVNSNLRGANGQKAFREFKYTFLLGGANEQ